MHTVELLEQAVDLAERLGYQARHEWLGGCGGGGCEIMGQKVLFLDLAVGPEDQLDRVLDLLRCEPGAAAAPMHHELRAMLGLRKSA